MKAIIPKSWLGFDSRNGRLFAGAGTEHDLFVYGVPPRTTIRIESRPQTEFRGERLFVHQPIAPHFLIHSVRVGNMETTAGYGPIPADAFATRMDRIAEIDVLLKQNEVFELKIDRNAYEILGMEWPLPAIQGGTLVMMTIENIDDHPHRFVAAWLGRTDSR